MPHKRDSTASTGAPLIVEPTPETATSEEPLAGAEGTKEADRFLRELYRRMFELTNERDPELRARIERDHAVRVERAVCDYPAILPRARNASILDIGFGDGWFLAACARLGYQNVSGADFAANPASRDWSTAVKETLSIDDSIRGFLASTPRRYDFIHLSHVIEHIPKYALLDTCDALSAALNPGGMLFVRTPNMEGPCPNSALFMTLGHEYGFSSSSLRVLLQVCGFEQIRFHSFSVPSTSLKQRIGNLLRRGYVGWNAAKHRLFGATAEGPFGTELIVSARKRRQ